VKLTKWGKAHYVDVPSDPGVTLCGLKVPVGAKHDWKEERECVQCRKIYLAQERDK